MKSLDMPVRASHKALQSKFSPGLELQERVLGYASFSLSFFLQPVEAPPSSVRLYLNSQQDVDILRFFLALSYGRLSLMVLVLNTARKNFSINPALIHKRYRNSEERQTSGAISSETGWSSTFSAESYWRFFQSVRIVVKKVPLLRRAGKKPLFFS